MPHPRGLTLRGLVWSHCITAEATSASTPNPTLSHHPHWHLFTPKSRRSLCASLPSPCLASPCRPSDPGLTWLPCCPSTTDRPSFFCATIRPITTPHHVRLAVPTRRSFPRSRSETLELQASLVLTSIDLTSRTVAPSVDFLPSKQPSVHGALSIDQRL